MAVLKPYFLRVLISLCAPSVMGMLKAIFFMAPSSSPFSKATRLPEAFLEIDLPAHGRFGDLMHLVTHIGHLGQFNDHFCLDERGIHVKANKPPVAAVNIILLEGNVNPGFARSFKKFETHPVLVAGSATHRKFDAGNRLGIVRNEGKDGR